MANIDDGFRVELLSLDDQTLIVSGNFAPDSNPGYEAPVGSLFLAQSGDLYIKFDISDTDWKTVNDKESLSALLDAMNEPTGHFDRDQSTIAFDDVTRTFSIDPRTPTHTSYDYYIQGIKHTISTTKTIQIPDTTGMHYIYFDGTETLQLISGSFQPFLVTEVALTTAVYWNSTSQQATYFGDERHGITMDGATHSHFHIALGTLYISGLGLANFTIGDGSSDSHAIHSVANGVIRDEDLSHTIADTGTGTNSFDLTQELDPVALIPVIYKSGLTGDWDIKATPTTFPFIHSGDGSGYVGANGRPAYNEFTGATWQLTEVGNNRYFFTHILATNDKRHPIIAVAGTEEYQNKPQGQEEARAEFAQFVGLPFAEFYPIATIILQSADSFTNSIKARIVPTDDGSDYIDWRDNEEFGLKIVSALSDHGNLTGLSDDDHTQYALAGSGSTRTFDLGDLTDATITTPTSNQVLTWNGTTWVNAEPPGATGGEANTATNVGVSGVGVFAQKAGVELQFKNITGNGTINVVDDTVNNEIDLSVDQGSINHVNLLNAGTNNHAQIDSHIADATIHFTETDIDHTQIQNRGTNTHAQIDSHLADSSIHFTVGSIDHTLIQNSGVNAHSVIDSHLSSTSNPHATNLVNLIDTNITGPLLEGDILSYNSSTSRWVDRSFTEAGIATTTQLSAHTGDGTIHFTQGDIDHNVILNNGTNTHTQIDSHIADATIHFTEASISHLNIQDVGTNTHAQIDSHIAATNNPHDTTLLNLTDTTITAPSNGQALVFNGSSWANTTLVDSDEQVKQSVTDTTPGYLNQKIVAGSNITLAVLNTGGNEQLQISATGTAGVTQLNDLTDVTLATPADQQVLTYDNATSQWINQTFAATGAQNIYESVAGDTGTTTADTITDTLTITGGTGITTSVTTDTVTIVNDAPNVDQNLFANIASDAGSTIASTTTDTLAVVGGTGISTSITGDILTVVNDAPNVDQNLFANIAGDTGTLTADTITDTVTVAGGNFITTTASDVTDTVTVNFDGQNISDLLNVNAPTPGNYYQLRYNSTAGEWQAYPAPPPPPAGGTNFVQLFWGPIPAITGTTLIPKDNTPPLITEGTEVLTQSITPTATTSTIRIAVNATISASTASLEFVFAVFRDNTCVGTAVNSTSNKGSGFSISFEIYDEPATSSPIVYSVRVGKTTSSGTWYVNDIQGEPNAFGDTLPKNSYSVEEIGLAG